MRDSVHRMERGRRKSIDDAFTHRKASRRYRLCVLRCALGVSTKRGVEIDDAGERGDTSQVILQSRLETALHRINSFLPHDTIEEVVRVLSNPPHPTLIENNRWFHALLTRGVEVEYPDPASGEMRGGRAHLVDFDNPGENDLLVVRQLTVTDPSGKRVRPDLTIFLNGLPVAVIELKAPAAAETSQDAAIDQLGRYKEMVPDLFVTNVALVVSDGLLTRVGSITSNRNRFMPWRPSEGGAPTLEALIRGLFEPEALVDYLRNCVFFEQDARGEIAKKIAGYHQFRAVRKMRASVLDQLRPPAGQGRRSGRSDLAHTGSGQVAHHADAGWFVDARASNG